MKVLEYNKWENFNNVINSSMIAYKNSEIDFSEHLPEIRKTIIMPKNASKNIKTFIDSFIKLQ